MNNRTQKVTLLIGGGGTGKTTIMLKLCMEVFVEYSSLGTRRPLLHHHLLPCSRRRNLQREVRGANSSHGYMLSRGRPPQQGYGFEKKESRNGEEMAAQDLTCRR